MATQRHYNNTHHREKGNMKKRFVYIKGNVNTNNGE